MFDSRTEKDKEQGIGYQIVCNTCGQISRSSHNRYCPVCGRDVIASFSAEKIDEAEYVYVAFKVEGRYTAKVRRDVAGDIKGWISAAQEQIWDADFGNLCDIDADVVNIEDEAGDFLYEKQEKHLSLLRSKNERRD